MLICKMLLFHHIYSYIKPTEAAIWRKGYTRNSLQWQWTPINKWQVCQLLLKNITSKMSIHHLTLYNPTDLQREWYKYVKSCWWRSENQAQTVTWWWWLTEQHLCLRTSNCEQNYSMANLWEQYWSLKASQVMNTLKWTSWQAEQMTACTTFCSSTCLYTRSKYKNVGTRCHHTSQPQMNCDHT